MPSQAVRAAVPHLGGMASAAARAAAAGFAGLPDAARAVVGMATAAAVRASAARPRRAARVVGFMSALLGSAFGPRFPVAPWPRERPNSLVKTAQLPEWLESAGGSRHSCPHFGRHELMMLVRPGRSRSVPKKTGAAGV